MNNALLLPLISSFSTLIGVIPIYLNIKRVEVITSFSVSLSMSVMIIISLFDLIPSSIPSIITSIPTILFMLAASPERSTRCRPIADSSAW